jgi:hypothetical protein
VIQEFHGVKPPAQFQIVPPRRAVLLTSIRSRTTSLVTPPLQNCPSVGFRITGSYGLGTSTRVSVSTKLFRRLRFSWFRMRIVSPVTGSANAAMPSKRLGVRRRLPVTGSTSVISHPRREMIRY